MSTLSDDFLEDNEMLVDSDDFFDLGEDDFNLPERLIFLQGEVVQGKVMDASENKTLGAMGLTLKILTGDHEGSLHEMMIFKPKAKDGKVNPIAKKQFVQFLMALWTKEQILNKQVDINSVIGKKLQFKSGKAREYNGKLYQNYSDFKVVE